MPLFCKEEPDTPRGTHRLLGRQQLTGRCRAWEGGLLLHPSSWRGGQGQLAAPRESQSTAGESTPLPPAPGGPPRVSRENVPVPDPSPPSQPHAARRGPTHDLTDAFAKPAETVQALAPACWGGRGWGPRAGARGETKPSYSGSRCRPHCSLRKDRGDSPEAETLPTDGRLPPREEGQHPSAPRAPRAGSSPSWGSGGPQPCCIRGSTTSFLKATLPCGVSGSSSMKWA